MNNHPGTLDLLYAVLDLQLVDQDGVRCGRVDDITLTDDGHIDQLIAGPAAWPRRLPRPIRRRAQHLADQAGVRTVNVPWEAVDHLGPYIHLNRSAEQLGLAQGDRELRWLIGKLPWAQTRQADPE